MAASSMRKVSSIFRKGLFQDKVAIVTGGGTGIGMAITEELLFLGCKVMIASRNVERLGKSAALLKNNINPSTKAEIDYVECNIRKEDQVKNLMDSTIQRFGGIDFLVNNSGGQFLAPTGDISLKGWNAVVETNLTGTFLCCREAFNQYMEEHGGSIVNIILLTEKGIPSMSHSGAARAAVENLCKSLAIEWADKGVRMNCVAPGSIYTETAAANYDDTFFTGKIPLIPAKRLGTVEEVSSAVCFLLSPAAAFITGSTMKVGGGADLYSQPYPVPDHSKSEAYTWEKDEVESSKL